MATTKQLCFTGHRKGYNFVVVEKAVREMIVRAYVNGFDRFACGMALGSDTVFAEEVLKLRDGFGEDQLFSDINLVAYVPFEGQELKWPQPHQLRYTELLRAANEVIYVSPPGYSIRKFADRNTRMVDESDAVMAVYDGKSAGGTSHCVEYASRQGKPIFLIHPYSAKGSWRLKPRTSE